MPQAIGLAVGSLLFSAGVALPIVNIVSLTIVPALVRVGIGLSFAVEQPEKDRSR